MTTSIYKEFEKLKTKFQEIIKKLCMCKVAILVFRIKKKGNKEQERGEMNEKTNASNAHSHFSSIIIKAAS